MPPFSSKVLLKGGTVLTHSSDEPPRVLPLFNHDVLVADGFISEVGRDINVDESYVKVIDCTDKIISPGFINTHAHLWQSQLKGRLSEVTLFSYFPRGGWVCYAYTPNDMYIGQLAGCLESLDGGTTTVIDHAHGCQSNEHIQQAIDATLDSGIRCLWAYAEPPRLQNWDEKECIPSYDLWNAKTAELVANLARKLNTASSRVELGLAFDLWFLPKEVVTPLFKQLTAAGVKTLTSHIGRNAVQGLGSPLSNIKQTQSIFDAHESYLNFENFVISHGTGFRNDDFTVIKTLRKDGLNIGISCTPTTEAPMSFHDTPAFNPVFEATGHSSTCSLGVDCHSSGTSYMPNIGVAAITLARVNSNAKYLAEGRYPTEMPGTLDEAFNMMTVYGARALGQDKAGGIGRLEVGRKADVVVVDTSRPGIGVAAQHNPLDALLTFSNTGDVEHVFVGGDQVKKDFRLSPFTYKGEKKEWNEFRKDLFASYEILEARIKKLNIQKAEEMIISLYHIDASRFGPEKA